MAQTRVLHPEMLNPTGPPSGPAVEQFKFAFGSLVDLYKWFFSLTRDIVIFSLLVVGWLVTSKYSRDYVQKNPGIQKIALAVIGTIFVLFTFEAVKIRRESRRKVMQLDGMAIADVRYYDHYEITGYMVYLGMGLVAVTFALLCAILYTA